MKKLLTIICVFSLFTANAQETKKETKKEREQRYIQEGNPFKELGYKPKIATLSRGKYREFFTDTIVQVGSFTYNRVSKNITGVLVIENKGVSEADLRPDLVSRWMSPDPLSDEFPDWSPYNFVNDNPIIYVDPTGLAPEIVNPVDEKSQLAYNTYKSNASAERQAQLSKLEASDVVYNVTVGADGNYTTYNFDTNSVEINVADMEQYTSGIMADEFTHAIQYENGDIGYFETKQGDVGTISYDLADEIDSKNAAVETFAQSGLKINDDYLKSKGGDVSAKYGDLLDKTGGNPSVKQIEKWANIKSRVHGQSYNNIIRPSGGSTKANVKNKANVNLLPKSTQRVVTKTAINN